MQGKKVAVSSLSTGRSGTYYGKTPIQFVPLYVLMYVIPPMAPSTRIPRPTAFLLQITMVLSFSSRTYFSRPVSSFVLEFDYLEKKVAAFKFMM